MSALLSQDIIPSPSEHEIYKCTLKVLGLEAGKLTDEEILEFISNFVHPSYIKGLFYDSFSSFYVVHLKDIEATSLLIGKTVQMSSYQATFLPLLDCFVVGNVYLSLSNKDIREIFGAFGNVFKVANYHVLPNSSKFFHVLSGTREVCYLLPGDESEVHIPLTVMHPPYTFHVQHLCLGCLTQGHSLLNCPDREDPDLPQVSKICKINDEKSLVISIKREMSFEVAKEDITNEKAEVENPSSSLSSECLNVEKPEEEVSSSSVSSMEEGNALDGNAKATFQEILPDMEEENALDGNSKAAFHAILPDIVGENPLEGIAKAKFQKMLLAFKAQSELKKKEHEKKNRMKTRKTLPGSKVSGLSENTFDPTSSLPKVNLVLSSSTKSFFERSAGVIPTEALVELMYIDARRRQNVMSYVSRFTHDVHAVLDQLRRLHKFLYDMKMLGTEEFRIKRKVWSLIRVLKKFRVGKNK